MRSPHTGLSHENLRDRYNLGKGRVRRKVTWQLGQRGVPAQRSKDEETARASSLAMPATFTFIPKIILRANKYQKYNINSVSQVIRIINWRVSRTQQLSIN